jgi:uncharacterized protein (UPF0335 family)
MGDGIPSLNGEEGAIQYSHSMVRAKQYPAAFPKHKPRARKMDAQPTGHNSKEQLKSLVERIENIETEIQERRSDQRDIYTEAKSNGFDVKALRTIIRLRKQDPNDRAEMEALLETYMQALGML